jgi:indolepyruvate ferredoxin oxidoreductase
MQNRIGLDDKYTVTRGRIFINGTQALVRLPMLQQELDRKGGLNTAGFISGYRGSPLGNYDSTLWREKTALAAHNIHFNPGVNEDLAATSVWGTQQLAQFTDTNVDGVFGLWYGKGPGVDRSGDALKHGNYSGTHPNGGVLVVFGDDHPGKSSTIAHQSEQALAANSIPVLYPANVEEFITFGLLGWSLSRFSGLWIGFKTVNETLEQTATIDIDVETFSIQIPETDSAADIHYKPGHYNPQADEMIVNRVRLPLVHQFVRANNIDRAVYAVDECIMGLVTAGKSYQDTMEALQLLAVDEVRAKELGIAVYKVGCIWPLEPEGIRAFAGDLELLFFIEEKKPFLELQAASVLYDLSSRPKIIGKRDEAGGVLLPSETLLDPTQVALAIAGQLDRLGVMDERLKQRVDKLTNNLLLVKSGSDSPLNRTPFFCSGCPHNTSTNLPEGSVAGGGIGCHGIAFFNRSDMLSFTHMGAEGVTWAGISPFVGTNHVFQNLGDGTYFHSGLLAIRASVAAGVNITYKLLYNDAVAMTGGQPIDGPISVGTITQQVLYEGVSRCVIVTDTPEAYISGADNVHSDVRIYHRDQLDVVQRELRETEGCSVLIYEQTCATEKRRRRNRGLLADPAKRMFINDAVCEGCGDCSVQSNCISIEPKETPLGIKRVIDQSSCNMDFSCVKGFCPSFVSVQGGSLKKETGNATDESYIEQLQAVKPATIKTESYNIMIAGVGGTGVITVGALLGMAAHLEGKTCSIYDMTGLAQKGGAVYSHLRIADAGKRINTQRIDVGAADLVMGFDLVGSMAKEATQTLAKDRTTFVGNTHIKPTAGFQTDADIDFSSEPYIARITSLLGSDSSHFVNATELALALCGDTIATNLFVVGFAAQKGLLPLEESSILEAIKLNGVAVDFNIKAFNLGRLWAEDRAKIIEWTKGAVLNDKKASDYTLEELIEHRTTLLTDYQSVGYADRYLALVNQVQMAEQRIANTDLELTRSVADSFAKLMAYKDEYEVARLYSSPEFKKKLEAQFSGDYKLKAHLAPPIISTSDKNTGNLVKKEFGGWVFMLYPLLAKLKILRGTRFDIMGYTQERQRERALIEEYEELMIQVCDMLSGDNLELAIELAELPRTIKGFGHVKMLNIDRAKKRESELAERLFK